MGIQTSAFITVNPSFIEPEFILNVNQASGAFDLLPGAAPTVKLGEGDLVVYMKTMTLRTKTAAGQATYNELPGVTIVNQYISTPTYKLRVRAQYDHNDVAEAGRWGYSAPEAYRLGMLQGNFQLARDSLLYGFNPQNGEGLINAPSATAINLPPDTNGNDTLVTYDNGQMAFFFATIFQNMKTRTQQMGIGQEFTVVGPQRILGPLEYNIVQLVQMQREGAGSLSTAGTTKTILLANGDKLIWTYDDTLIGKGAGGNDAVIFGMPRITKPNANRINTNIFDSLSPGTPDCTKMYADMAAPRDIISPLAGGATDVLTEWRITPGWGIRPEGLTILSIQYQ